MGDYIGMESCVDLKPDVEPSHVGNTNRRRSGGGRRGAADGGYPPPIPALASTEQLPSWVMHKYYSGDGRLIITEEKVKRHEYLQAHRSDGRLTLDLVPLDDGVDGEEEEKSGGGDGEMDYPTVVESTKCRNSIGVKVKPCGGSGVHVAPFSRPVHTV